MGLGRMRKALTDYKRAAQVNPRDPDLRKKLSHCEKEVKRIRFEEAVATPVSLSSDHLQETTLSSTGASKDSSHRIHTAPARCLYCAGRQAMCCCWQKRYLSAVWGLVLPLCWLQLGLV